MRRQSAYTQGGTLKIALYALGLILLVTIGFLMFHDIQVPTEHVSQKISVDLDN